ncbi:hypothetical protein I5468_20295 [Citrobacter koseri]|uniref:hypothetical protein n=1 Tax=Citrobacter koseri TaxID=545 RepID=UPI001903B339|nr:hypothetical protein [Citrobacter koseri]MBJ9169538.1 hypothetical protein [Citrobacter koseri]HEM8056824.1 hypothetical protein [Citrobacter koseri]
MVDNIDSNLNNVKNKISTFKENPALEANNANLRGALSILNNTNVLKFDLTPSEFKKYRLDELKYHIEIIELFEKQHIKNYRSSKPYHMNVMPPQGAVDGPIFGTVDPAIIKNKKTREQYKSDLEENNKIGKEIAFQGELTKLKYVLEAPNIKIGSIATIELFIKNHYTNDSFDIIEIKKSINESKLEPYIKNKILDDTIGHKNSKQ